MRRELALLLALLPALLFAQNKVHLEFESAGPRTGWIGDLGSSPPEKAQKWDGKSVDLDASGAKPDAFLQVLDANTGNLAAKRLADASKGLLVRDSDFNLIGHVQVSVVHDGAPLEFATVTLNDGAKSKDQIVDPSSKGIADFYGVKAGSIKVTAKYKVGQESKTQNESFDVALKRDLPVPVHVMTIVEPVATVQVAGSASDQAPTKESAKAAPEHPSNPFGSVFVYLLAVCFVILVIYLGFTWLTRNPQKSRAAMQKLGVQLQDPITPSHSAATQVAPQAPPEPQPQIILQDAAPTPLGVAAMPAAPSIPGGPPGLVQENGQRFDLPEGTFSVGRDAAAGIALPYENSVSRRHAEVVRTGDSVVVRDLGSSNGTFVNGIKVNGEATLRPGDTVQFGTVRFRFEG